MIKFDLPEIWNQAGFGSEIKVTGGQRLSCTDCRELLFSNGRTFLAEILQQRVWNVVESLGKFREDSCARPLDFKLPVEDSSSGSAPVLWIFSFPAGH